MSVWNDFASLIGVAPRHAEAALYSERAAKATLSRRAMFGASAALAAGVAFGFPTSAPVYVPPADIAFPDWVRLSMAIMPALYFYGQQEVLSAP